MRNRFDRELVQLNDELIEMGSLIEKAIEMAVTALVKQDAELAQKTIAMATEIDNQERTIENLCLKLLLQQQPVARDLRVISAALKMMERTQEMAKEATVMLVKSIEAFVNKDIVLAGEVIGRDDRVDELFAEIKDELIDLIHQDTNNGAQAADFLMIAKYLERIGDHATNIAEWVIFSITGQHKSYETEKNGQKA